MVILATGKVGVVQDYDRENKKVLVVDDFGAGRGKWFDPVLEVELREWMQ